MQRRSGRVTPVTRHVHGCQAVNARPGQRGSLASSPQAALGHNAEIRIYAWRCGDESREAITMLALGMTSGADE
jgi:hypothetical protein